MYQYFIVENQIVFFCDSNNLKSIARKTLCKSHMLTLGCTKAIL